MKAILLGRRAIADKALYDSRYFYFDDNDVMHSTCGIAFQTLMGVYRETAARVQSHRAPFDCHPERSARE